MRRGDLAALAQSFGEADTRGEIVLIIGPPAAAPAADIGDADPLLRAALTRASLKDAVSEVAQATGLPRREVYQRALALVKEEPET